MTVASPILTALAVPATLLVNSEGLPEAHERWWEILERLPLPASDLEAINRAMWSLDADGRWQLVADVLARTGADTRARASHRVMTGDEVCELAHRPGHSIGAHTVHHLALTTQPLETKRCEVITDKAALEQTIGAPVPLFSYPYGDYDVNLSGQRGGISGRGDDRGGGVGYRSTVAPLRHVRPQTRCDRSRE